MSVKCIVLALYFNIDGRCLSSYACETTGVPLPIFVQVKPDVIVMDKINLSDVSKHWLGSFFVMWVSHVCFTGNGKAGSICGCLL